MDFQKKMTGFYMHSVCLPEKVTKHFTGLVGKFLKFKCPGGGDAWQVGLIGSGDKLVLQPGWSTFASSNNVWQNDLLTFKLVSGSTFEVRIFDPLGWEISPSSEEEEEKEATNDVSIGKELEVQVQEGTMSHASSRIKIVTEEDGTSAKRSAFNLHAGKKRSLSHNQNSFALQKRLKTSDCPSLWQEEEKVVWKEVHRPSKEKEDEFLKELDEARRNDLLVPAHQNLLTGKKGLLETGTSETESHTENNSNQNLRDCGVPTDYVCGPVRWQTMTAEQKTRANCLALEIKAGNPAFLHILQKSCLNNRPTIFIPKEFSAKHLPDQNQTIVLRRPEKESTWDASYYFCTKRQRIESRSLLKFMRENNLQEGDICMFELDRTANQITFIVHVSQAT